MSAATGHLPSSPLDPDIISSPTSVSNTGSLGQVLSTTSRRAAAFELQIKALEEKLAEDLSNCRAIESSLKDAFTTIKVCHGDAALMSCFLPSLI